MNMSKSQVRRISVQLYERLMALRRRLLDADIKLSEIPPLAVPRSAMHAFQAVYSDQPPAMIGDECECVGFKCVVVKDRESSEST